MNTFTPADILLPQVAEMEKWAVIACDQFTSQPEYWERVRRFVGTAPSALNLILPEVELSGPYERRIPQINAAMARYLEAGLFRALPRAYVYVERTLSNGELRRGLLGGIDLEQYDYRDDAASPIRATERTVVERIPPRVKIREDAPLELPHVLLLCDDEERRIIEPLGEKTGALEKLYDFELMEGGGHIAAWLLQGEEAAAVDRALAAYAESVRARYGALTAEPMLFAVGDGNHSLATAKACYEALKRELGPAAQGHPARYALVELENLHDPVQRFAPIHRLITHTDPEALLALAQQEIGTTAAGIPLRWYCKGKSGVLTLDPAKGELPVGILQGFLDAALSTLPGQIDYIHGDDALRELSEAEGALGFLLPPIEKGAFFRGIMADGVLPRKTFSMGQARDKRYYLEARKIR